MVGGAYDGHTITRSNINAASYDHVDLVSVNLFVLCGVCRKMGL